MIVWKLLQRHVESPTLLKAAILLCSVCCAMPNGTLDSLDLRHGRLDQEGRETRSSSSSSDEHKINSRTAWRMLQKLDSPSYLCLLADGADSSLSDDSLFADKRSVREIIRDSISSASGIDISWRFLESAQTAPDRLEGFLNQTCLARGPLPEFFCERLNIQDSPNAMYSRLSVEKTLVMADTIYARLSSKNKRYVKGVLYLAALSEQKFMDEIASGGWLTNPKSKRYRRRALASKKNRTEQTYESSEPPEGENNDNTHITDEEAKSQFDGLFLEEKA